MRVLLAYVSLVVLWSLTPLAIKWSGEGPGHLFGVLARMSIGYFGVILVMLITRTPLPLDGRALITYLAGSLQIFGSMSLTYWSSQHLPSGWISVVFGLTPLLTAPLSALMLGESSLTFPRLLSYFFGVLGLVVIFHAALGFSPSAYLGVTGLLMAAFLQALSAVWVKSIDRRLNPFAQVAGSLSLSVPLYLLSFLLFDGHWPDQIPRRSIVSIFFLGAIATTFGFALYFYILRKLTAGRVALITLLTPVLSLYVGDLVNHEPIQGPVILGTGLILMALILYEWRSLSIGSILKRIR